MIGELRRELPGVEITVFSRDAEDTRRRHGVERALPVRKMSRAEVVPEIQRLDLLLFGGGGIVYDAEVKLYLREMLVAKELGVPVMVYAVGAGPLGQAEDPDPAAGFATFYVVTPQPASGVPLSALGCAAPGLCSAGTCELGGGPCNASGGTCGECLRIACNSAAQDRREQEFCPHGGICLDADPAAPAAQCPAGGDPRKVVRQVDAADFCP